MICIYTGYTAVESMEMVHNYNGYTVDMSIEMVHKYIGYNVDEFMELDRGSMQSGWQFSVYFCR